MVVAAAAVVVRIATAAVINRGQDAVAITALVVIFSVVDLTPVVLVIVEIVRADLVVQLDRFIPRVALGIEIRKVIRAGDAGQHQRETRDSSAQVHPHTNTLFQKKQSHASTTKVPGDSLPRSTSGRSGETAIAT